MEAQRNKLVKQPARREPASVVISWLELVLGFTVTHRDSPLDSRGKKRKALFHSRAETGSPRFVLRRIGSQCDTHLARIRWTRVRLLITFCYRSATAFNFCSDKRNYRATGSSKNKQDFRNGVTKLCKRGILKASIYQYRYLGIGRNDQIIAFVNPPISNLTRRS